MGDDADITEEQADALAKQFHEEYEYVAPELGYETRNASRKPWADVPEKNKRVMRATMKAMFFQGDGGVPLVRNGHLMRPSDLTDS